LLAAVLSRCRLVIGVDTGALQVAAVIGCRCIGIYYGSMNFRETGPYGQGNLVVAPDHPLYPCQEWEMERRPGVWAREAPPEAVASAIAGMGESAGEWRFSNLALYKGNMSERGLEWRRLDRKVKVKVEVKNGISTLTST